MKSEFDDFKGDFKGEASEVDTPSSSSLESHTAKPAHTHRLFGIFIVNEGVTYINLITYLIACFGTICLIVYLSIIQNYVVTVILGITQNTGTLTGNLALYDEIIALPATLVWGIMSDRVGRRYVYGSGFACIGASLICYSYVRNVYPQMLMCRLLFSLGTAACTCMMTGTLGDIAGGKHERGRGIELCFRIVGGVAIGFAAFVALTIPKVKTSADYMNPIKMLKYGIIAGRDPRISLAYLSSFVARADTVLFTSYMSLWVIHYYMDKGYCTQKTSCGAAAGDTHMLTGMGQGIPLVFAPIFGMAGEYFKKSTVLAVAGIIGAVGSLPFAFTKDGVSPADKANFVWVCLVGVGQIGTIVTGMSIVNGVYIDPKYRGSVAGVFSFCGAVSIMVMAKLGGYLFDAPFVLMGVAHGVIALFSIYVRLVTPRLEEEDRKRMAAAGIVHDGLID
ncbi:hypothetical protein BG000_008635 [Podila horticola]|nr:hypothetical protein BG000_008635 [Podila horticola]